MSVILIKKKSVYHSICKVGVKNCIKVGGLMTFKLARVTWDLHSLNPVCKASGHSQKIISKSDVQRHWVLLVGFQLGDLIGATILKGVVIGGVSIGRCGKFYVPNKIQR